MMIVEDPAMFLADFGVTVQAGAISGLGLYDEPSEIVMDGAVVSTDHSILCLQSLFGGLQYGDAITVDGRSFHVREVLPTGDAVFVRINLKQ